MKYAIDQAGFDALSDELKALYTKAGDGYQLAIEGLPDVAGLKAQVESLMDEKKSATRARKEAEELAKQAAEERARKEGDVAALENSWKAKLAELENGYKAQLDGMSGTVNTLLIDNVAHSLATKLAGEAAPVLLPHIKSRLAVEYAEGKPQTRVLDATGKPSALSVEELGKEFAGNKVFSGVVIGSKAEGTGGAGVSLKPASGAGGDQQADRVARAAQIISSMGN